MVYRYLTYGISITVISWIVGMIINTVVRKTAFYNTELSNLNFVKNGKLNKFIGIGIFKWIVKYTLFKFFNQKLKLKNKISQAELINLRNEMTISEIDHLIGFGFVAIFALVKAFNSNYLFGLVIIMVNTLMNLYPSLLQQENKRRIDKLMRNYS